ncbi:hypothetical protein FEDK69T_08050 [Flavobacterium enshiense DK69]|uniref:Lipoprotein n=1 Tax=Flavobacterium enshiense DK69 TaxID=1107311 RepID=V6SD19_9FLAO|nr:hypothetical protein [Flavobacterium enshiense]ESU24359.1 hypothetical protein FEDK69T_08050 [Flavobacterium enshiense DK69]KGO94465.1 hypothetical protein Q767_12915 [Flavobacterium enshiense DK69]
MKRKLLYLFFLILLIQSCKKNKEESYDSESFVSAVEETSYGNGYADNTYCAEVEYYNPNTGTRSTYTLNVEVENNELTVIHWPNGGWLDEDHFSPEELDSDGSCSFTSDRGYEYTVQINGPECSFTDESRMQSDVEEDKEAVTCPGCGGEKNEFDDLCWYCERKERRNKEEEENKKKDIEEHTCKRCGQYDTFMWSSDDMCSDCKRNTEEE